MGVRGRERGGLRTRGSTGVGTARAERPGPHPVVAALGKRGEAGDWGRERGGSMERGSTGAGTACAERPWPHPASAAPGKRGEAGGGGGPGA